MTLPQETIDVIFKYMPLQYSFGISKYNIKTRFDHKIHTWDYAIFNNSLAMIKWLHNISANNWQTIKWKPKNEYLQKYNKISGDSLILCSRLNTIDIFKYIYINKRELFSDIPEVLHENGLFNGLSCRAVAYNAIDVFKYIYETVYDSNPRLCNGGLTRVTHDFNTAIYNENLEIIKYIYNKFSKEYTLEVDTNAISNIVSSDNYEIFHFLYVKDLIPKITESMLARVQFNKKSKIHRFIKYFIVYDLPSDEIFFESADPKKYILGPKIKKYKTTTYKLVAVSEASTNTQIANAPDANACIKDSKFDKIHNVSEESICDEINAISRNNPLVLLYNKIYTKHNIYDYAIYNGFGKLLTTLFDKNTELARVVRAPNSIFIDNFAFKKKSIEICIKEKNDEIFDIIMRYKSHEITEEYLSLAVEFGTAHMVKCICDNNQHSVRGNTITGQSVVINYFDDRLFAKAIQSLDIDKVKLIHNKSNLADFTYKYEGVEENYDMLRKHIVDMIKDSVIPNGHYKMFKFLYENYTFGIDTYPPISNKFKQKINLTNYLAVYKNMLIHLNDMSKSRNISIAGGIILQDGYPLQNNMNLFAPNGLYIGGILETNSITAASLHIHTDASVDGDVNVDGDFTIYGNLSVVGTITIDS